MKVAAPRHADAGQREAFVALMRSRGALYTLVLVGALVLVFGAAQGSTMLMLGGPVIVAVMVASVCAFLADRMAARSFHTAFAATHGLRYVGRVHLLTLTPLLGAGDRRWCDHWMTGALGDDPVLHGGMGQFCYEQDPPGSESRNVAVAVTAELAEARHRFTAAVVDIEASLPLFHGVFIHPRRGVVDHFDDWLDHPPSHEIELESTAFTQRYDLRIADEQDELRARQLLAPTLVDWLASHPLGPCLELRGGTLVVFTRRVIEDAGNLTFFLEAVRELSGRVLREVDEAVAGAAPAPRASVPPPS